MNKQERSILNRLMIVCNNLGSPVDLTAISTQYLYDRQQALMDVSNIIYGILTQHSDNEYGDNDMNKAIKSLEKIEKLVDKIYFDKNGK